MLESVDWLLQHGALDQQTRHFKERKSNKRSPNSLLNQQLLEIADFRIEAMADKTRSDFLTITKQRMGMCSLIIVGQASIKQRHEPTI